LALFFLVAQASACGILLLDKKTRSHQQPHAEDDAEKLTICHFEGRALPEKSVFSLGPRRKADSSLRSG
jgi:hypothetical protein